MTGTTPGFRNLDGLTGASIHSVVFSTAKGFGRGYDTNEVDSFVTTCAQALDQMRERLRLCEAEIARLHQQIADDGRGAEVEQAMNVLTTAQRTADKVVAQADEYSARVMEEARELYDEARRNAAIVEQETEEKARHVYEDSVNRASELEREAQARIVRLSATATSAQKDLDEQTAYLRTLRDATRTQMRTFLEGLLDHIAGEYGRAHPIAAGAVVTPTPTPPPSPRQVNQQSGTGNSATRSAGQRSRTAKIPNQRRRQTIAGGASSLQQRSTAIGPAEYYDRSTVSGIQTDDFYD